MLGVEELDIQFVILTDASLAVGDSLFFVAPFIRINFTQQEVCSQYLKFVFSYL